MPPVQLGRKAPPLLRTVQGKPRAKPKGMARTQETPPPANAVPRSSDKEPEYKDAPPVSLSDEEESVASMPSASSQGQSQTTGSKKAPSRGQRGHQASSDDPVSSYPTG